MTGPERTMLRQLIHQARKHAIHKQPGCVSCGTPYDQENPGCWHCNERHRKRRNRTRRSAITRGWCAGCMKPYWEHTHGCLQCQERQRGRQRRKTI
jgi:hypothetical protein